MQKKLLYHQKNESYLFRNAFVMHEGSTERNTTFSKGVIQREYYFPIFFVKLFHISLWICVYGCCHQGTNKESTFVLNSLNSHSVLTLFLCRRNIQLWI